MTFNSGFHPTGFIVFSVPAHMLDAWLNFANDLAAQTGVSIMMGHGSYQGDTERSYMWPERLFNEHLADSTYLAEEECIMRVSPCEHMYCHFVYRHGGVECVGNLRQIDKEETGSYDGWVAMPGPMGELRYWTTEPMPLLEAPEQQSEETVEERVARIVYEGMRFDRDHDTPDWVDGGNSIVQTVARQRAEEIMDLLAPEQEEPANNGVLLPIRSEVAVYRDADGDTWIDNPSGNMLLLLKDGRAKYTDAANITEAQKLGFAEAE